MSLSLGNNELTFIIKNLVLLALFLYQWYIWFPKLLQEKRQKTILCLVILFVVLNIFAIFSLPIKIK